MEVTTYCNRVKVSSTIQVAPSIQYSTATYRRTGLDIWVSPCSCMRIQCKSRTALRGSLVHFRVQSLVAFTEVTEMLGYTDKRDTIAMHLGHEVIPSSELDRQVQLCIRPHHHGNAAFALGELATLRVNQDRGASGGVDSIHSHMPLRGPSPKLLSESERCQKYRKRGLLCHP